MCIVCEQWSRSGPGVAGGGATPDPRATPAPVAGAGAPPGSDARSYVFLPDLWPDAPGRTFTWSNATANPEGDARQSWIEAPLTDAQVILVRRAFSMWAAVADVSFQEVSDSAESDIRFGLGEIDGAGGTAGLAPSWNANGYRTQALVVFDAEDYGRAAGAAGGAPGIGVVAHEIGHALGLAHSPDRDSIMHAFGGGRTTLHASDIAGIQALYGPRSGSEPSSLPVWPGAIDLGDLNGLAATGIRADTLDRPNDETDLYRFTLSSPRTMRFEVRDPADDVWLTLNDASGRQLGLSDNQGTADESLVHPLGPGDYYLAVRHAYATEGVLGYTLHYGPERWSPAGPVANLGNLTGLERIRHRTDSVDWSSSDTYRFRLSDPQAMRFELTNLTEDADLALLDASGEIVDRSLSFGTTPDSIVHELGPGTYYIRVDALGSGTIDYELRFGPEALPSPESIIELGNLADPWQYPFRWGTVNQATNPDDYYRFVLPEAWMVSLTVDDSLPDGGNIPRILDDPVSTGGMVSTGGLARNDPGAGDAARSLGSAEGRSAGTALSVLDTSGWKTWDSTLGGARGDHLLLPLDAGTYYIRVNAADPGTIGYRLRYAVAPLLELGDLGALTTTRTRSEWLPTPGDFDVFRFTLSNPRTLRFELHDPQGYADLSLFDGSGSIVGSSDKPGGTIEWITRKLEAGTYYLHVDTPATGAEVVPTVLVPYELRYRPADLPPAGRTADLGDLTGASSYLRRTDSVSIGREDFYRFTLAEARGVWLFADNLSADANLSLSNAFGQEIAASKNQGRSFDSVYPVLDAGTYYIRVDAVAHGNVGYTLSGASFALVDLGDLTGMTASRARQGTVERANDDLDGFRFTLTDTRTLYFKLHGLAATSDVNLHLFKASGEVAGNAQQSHGGIAWIVRELDAGAYYVAVDAWSDGLVGYELHYGPASVESVLPHRPGPWSPPETAIELGDLTRVSGRRGDSVILKTDADDYYRFTLSGDSDSEPSGVSIRLDDLEGRDWQGCPEIAGVTCKTFAVLSLLDDSGGEIERARYDHQADTEANDTITRSLAPGTYYIRVQAAQDDYPDAGALDYTLSYRHFFDGTTSDREVVAEAPAEESLAGGTPQGPLAGPLPPIWRDEAAPAIRPDERKRQVENPGGLLAI